MDLPTWQLRLSVSRARVTDDATPLQGPLVIVIRAPTREDAIAAVGLAELLTLPDGRLVRLVRYLPTSLMMLSRTRRGATKSPHVTKHNLRPQS